MPKRAIELFAGVGGFRLGLERAGWDVTFSNQWEPGKKKQWAFECYSAHFKRGIHSNQDIAAVKAIDIPDHELLVGGFPCQDYSVATTQAEGLKGKKGVLWWEIHRILKAKRPPYLLLENVDRLLKSPTTQRGRDFGVMLSCLDALGYAVEWRVINAADYSAPQRRRRVFIAGAHRATPLGQVIADQRDNRAWLQAKGFFAGEFPVVAEAVRPINPEEPQILLPADLQRVSDKFQFPFENAGIMVDRRIWTIRCKAKPEPTVPLASVLQDDVPENYFITDADVSKWKYLKGAKSEPRTARNGFQYHYSEGPIPFPDRTDQPARTILTSEGGTSPSRFKHLVLDPVQKRLRVLTPLEVERLNQFPDNWTNTGMPEGWRYFCMGNALIVGLVERMAARFASWTPTNATKKVRVVTAVRS